MTDPVTIAPGQLARPALDRSTCLQNGQMWARRAHDLREQARVTSLSEWSRQDLLEAAAAADLTAKEWFRAPDAKPAESQTTSTKA